MIRIVTILSILFLLEGCVYPNRQVQILDDRPSLSVVDAPQNAILYVDGLEIGPANNFNGNPNILRLEPGTHHVEIRQGKDVIHSLDVFLAEGTQRKIKLSGSKQ